MHGPRRENGSWRRSRDFQRRGAGTGCRPAAFLPRLPCTDSATGRTLRALLAGDPLHRTTVLPDLRLSPRLRGRRGCAVRCLHPSQARLWPRACGHGLRRGVTRSVVGLQAWRPDRFGRPLRRLAGPRRRAAVGRRGPHRTGTAASRPALAPALQSVGAAGRAARRDRGGPDRPRSLAPAPGDAAHARSGTRASGDATSRAPSISSPGRPNGSRGGACC